MPVVIVCSQNSTVCVLCGRGVSGQCAARVVAKWRTLQNEPALFHCRHPVALFQACALFDDGGVFFKLVRNRHFLLIVSGIGDSLLEMIVFG